MTEPTPEDPREVAAAAWMRACATDQGERFDRVGSDPSKTDLREQITALVRQHLGYDLDTDDGREDEDCIVDCLTNAVADLLDAKDATCREATSKLAAQLDEERRLNQQTSRQLSELLKRARELAAAVR